MRERREVEVNRGQIGGRVRTGGRGDVEEWKRWERRRIYVDGELKERGCAVEKQDALEGCSGVGWVDQERKALRRKGN